MRPTADTEVTTFYDDNEFLGDDGYRFANSVLGDSEEVMRSISLCRIIVNDA